VMLRHNDKVETYRRSGLGRSLLIDLMLSTRFSVIVDFMSDCDIMDICCINKANDFP